MPYQFRIPNCEFRTKNSKHALAIRNPGACCPNLLILCWTNFEPESGEGERGCGKERSTTVPGHPSHKQGSASFQLVTAPQGSKVTSKVPMRPTPIAFAEEQQKRWIYIRGPLNTKRETRNSYLETPPSLSSTGHESTDYPEDQVS